MPEASLIEGPAWRIGGLNRVDSPSSTAVPLSAPPLATLAHTAMLSILLDAFSLASEALLVVFIAGYTIRLRPEYETYYPRVPANVWLDAHRRSGEAGVYWLNEKVEGPGEEVQPILEPQVMVQERPVGSGADGERDGRPTDTGDGDGRSRVDRRASHPPSEVPGRGSPT